MAGRSLTDFPHGYFFRIFYSVRDHAQRRRALRSDHGRRGQLTVSVDLLSKAAVPVGLVHPGQRSSVTVSSIVWW